MARRNYGALRTRPISTRRRRGWQGSMRLGALFAVLVGINIYVFFFRGGTSIRDVLKSGAISSQPIAAGLRGKRQGTSTSADALRQPLDGSIVLQGTLKGHRGLLPALSALQVSDGEARELVAALQTALDMRALRPEHRFEVRLDPSTKQIRQFTYRFSSVSAVVVNRLTDGTLKASREEVQLDTKVATLGGVVTSSLDGAMSALGETSALVAMFVDLFVWDINWYTDPREGDEFRIVVEKKYAGGKFHRYGRILAAEYRGKVGRFQAFYFEPRGDKAGHFTTEGRSITRDFLKMPLNFRRISSRFDRHRFHPVLHQTRGHFGVDYAAPTGTPVWAAGDGVVVSAGRSGGAGNMLVLRHSQGRVSIYMHLSRFARGLKPGLKVHQREVVAYVGSTGLSTGPHLHYSLRVGGSNVDPLKYEAGKGPLLRPNERVRFLDELPKRVAALSAVATAERQKSAPAERQKSAPAERRASR